MQNETTPAHRLCRHLRTKKMFYVAEMSQVTKDLLTSNTYQPFWCQQTMTDTGPDDGYVEHPRCRPGRDCYEAMEG